MTELKERLLNLATNTWISIGLTLGLLQVSRWFDFTNPAALLILRVLYVSAQLTVLSLSFRLIKLIAKKDDQTQLKYVEPPKPGETESELITTTYHDYDLTEAKKLRSQLLIGMLLTAVIHLWWGTCPPLVIQLVLPLKSFLTSKVALVHIWGQSVRRPFKVEGPFGQLMQQPLTDRASIKKMTKGNKKKKL
ncbi:uncharacterized protein VTP21DRAFT_5356 [Calcarisporiella thermophila]|uniref:uncharacterized protein n=1 Tax=Calcarisporiella thermophila TaxID=911321 RepID=UPI003743F6EB